MKVIVKDGKKTIITRHGSAARDAYARGAGRRAASVSVSHYHFQQRLVWIGFGFVVLALMVRAVSMKIPVVVNQDDYAFGLVARDVLQGKLPYTGIFDNKPVGLIYVFAASEWIGGQSVVALHAVGFVASAATGLILYGSTRRQKLAPSLGIAVTALFLFEVLNRDGWASMSELVACPFLALVNYWVLQEKWHQPWFLLGCGAIFGIVCQITYLAVPSFALMALGILALGAHRTRFSRLRDAALMAVGFGVLTLLIWTPQLLAGNWHEYMAQQVGYHEHYRVASPSFVAWMYRSIRLIGLVSVPILGALGVLALLERAALVFSAPFLVIGLELAGAFIAMLASNRMYSHYSILTLPAISLLIAMMFKRSSERSARVGVDFLLLFVAVLAVGAVLHLPAMFRMSQFAVQTSAAVDRLTQAGQSIYVFSETPAIYFLSHRDAASRYIWPTHYIDTCYQSNPVITPEAAFAQALARHPALLVIGFSCPVEMDAGALARKSGYQQVQRIDVDGRRVVLYAPAAGSVSGTAR